MALNLTLPTLLSFNETLFCLFKHQSDLLWHNVPYPQNKMLGFAHWVFSIEYLFNSFTRVGFQQPDQHPVVSSTPQHNRNISNDFRQW